MSSNLEKLQESIMVEVRSTVVRSGKPKLIPAKDVDSYTGFRSMYGYSTNATSYINETKSTRGLANFPVYSDTLYVDFDDNEEAANQFEVEHLSGYGYTKYHSGGRSIHFHIPIEPMYGKNVPQSQKIFMEQVAPKADMSIYRHTGLYRLPGTYHPKNPGKKKEVICEYWSDTLLKIENKPRVHVPTEASEQDADWHYNILGKLLHMKVGVGGRHQHLFKIGMACRSAQKDMDYARKLLGMYNDDNCFPAKREWELDKIIKWIYSQ